MDIRRWVDPDTHGWIIRPKSNDDWDALVAEYGSQHSVPLAKTIETVRANGCRTVVVENRYVDPDYRSDYSAFWSRRFDGIPAFARRLHFFNADVAEDELHRLPPDATYLGYSVIRPLPFGP